MNTRPITGFEGAVTRSCQPKLVILEVVMDGTRACPKCGFEQSSQNLECHGCGVIFSKLAYPPEGGGESAGFEGTERWESRSQGDSGSLLTQVLDRALHLPSSPHSGTLAAHAVIWVALLVFGWSFLSTDLARSQMSSSLPHLLLSRVNLVFHEAGHIVFRPLGDFMSTLGGSLLQVLVPLICTGAFLTRHLELFSASVTLWWAGQSLVDLGPYIWDARVQQLMLLGGVTGRDRPGYHDWNNILGRLGMLQYDHSLAKLAHYSGSALMVLALVWGGYLIFVQWKLKTES